MNNFIKVHKEMRIKLMIAFCAILCPYSAITQGVTIDASGNPPHSKAMLDIVSVEKGVLIPRLPRASRDTFTNVPQSLLIYNTTDSCLQIYIDTVWLNITCVGNPGCNGPSTPVVGSASNVTDTSFVANWNSVSNTSSYNLWVDNDSDFSSPLNGYGPKSGISSVSEVVNGLTCDSTYYYKVQAKNNCGVSANSSTITVTTSSCPTTAICGGIEFMNENLNTGTMVNSGGGGQQQTNNGTIEKFCYNDVPSNCNTYGGLYEWREAMDYSVSSNSDPSGVQGICPAGYHLPSDDEWSDWECCLEGMPDGCGVFDGTTGWRGTNAGEKMKDDASWNGTNTSGFTALPSGFRLDSDGSFNNLNTSGLFWSSTEATANRSWYRDLNSSLSQSARDNAPKSHGFSVRCIKD